jgi:hypothetical protein
VEIAFTDAQVGASCERLRSFGPRSPNNPTLCCCGRFMSGEGLGSITTSGCNAVLVYQSNDARAADREVDPACHPASWVHARVVGTIDVADDSLASSVSTPTPSMAGRDLRPLAKGQARFAAGRAVRRELVRSTSTAIGRRLRSSVKGTTGN